MAWERILKELITKRWIKIRDYGEYLSVQVFAFDHDSTSRLRFFFESYPESYSSEMQIRQRDLSEGRTKIATIAELEEELGYPPRRARVQ